MSSEIQVLIVLVFSIFGFGTYLIIFSKFYIKFRTCISSPIHCYFIYKAIQNILKNIWNSKFSLKSGSGQVGRPYGRLVPMTSQNGRPGLWPRCTFVHVVGRLFVYVVGWPTGRPLTLAVDRLKDPYSWFGSVDRGSRPTFYFSL